MRTALAWPVIGLLACLPQPPELSGEPPPLDLGSVHETWSEDDLPPWGPEEDEEPTPESGDSTDSGAGETTSGEEPPPKLDPGLSLLRLTEVLPDPDGKDGEIDSPELVELHNPSTDTVDLTGLVIESRAWPVLGSDALGLGGMELSAGQRLVIERYANDVIVPVDRPLITEWGIAAAFSTGSGLRNGDGAVLVRGSLGEVADLVVYGAGQEAPFDDPEDWTSAPVQTPPAGSSTCRTAPENDTNGHADWANCVPNPGLAYEPPPQIPTTGEVTIVEVLSNPPGPASEEKLYEFVEIRNTGDEAVDLRAFRVADSLDPDASGIDPLEFVAGDGGCEPAGCLAPDGLAVIVGNAYAGETGDALVMATDDTTIANAGLSNTEAVALRDGLDEISSTYRDWPDSQAEPNPSSTELSLVRASPEAADLPESWAFAAPSPGG
jgi:hypothetical protein